MHTHDTKGSPRASPQLPGHPPFPGPPAFLALFLEATLPFRAEGSGAATSATRAGLGENLTLSPIHCNPP